MTQDGWGPSSPKHSPESSSTPTHVRVKRTPTLTQEALHPDRAPDPVGVPSIREVKQESRVVGLSDPECESTSGP